MRKSNIKKVASLLAIAMTMTTVMAGCGNSGSSDATPAATTTASAATTAAGTENVETTTALEKKGKVSVMVYDRAEVPPGEGDYTNNRWTRWISENAPLEEVTFVPIARSEATETMQMLFAAGQLPDVLCNGSDALIFVQNGVTLEITDEMLDKMPNYKMILEQYPMCRKTGTFDGKLQTLTKFSPIGANHTIVIRKDWLDKLGMENPTTPEELFDIIYAFTYNDPDGNGVNDTWGINMSTDAQRILSHMYGFPNPQKYAMVNGELVYAWDRIESWLTFCKKIVDAGCVNPDFLTMKGDDDQADFLSGRIGIYCSGRFTNSSRQGLWNSVNKNLPGAVLDTFALPATEHGQFTAYVNGGSSNTGFINSECKDVEAALAYANWLYDPEVSEYLMYGPEDVYYSRNDYGTYAIVDNEKNKVEFNYAGYSVIRNELFTGAEEEVSPLANTAYNVYLSSDDSSLYGLGDLMYKFDVIANDKNTIDPRKWLNDGLPILPADLALISSTADAQVNNILKAALADSSMTVEQAMKDARAAWYDAGGQQVDDYYANYYKEMGDKALLADDFTNSKIAPELTPAAKANSKVAN